MKPISLTKVTGQYSWKTHYMTQVRGIVFMVTKMEWVMPYTHVSWSLEASRGVLPNNNSYRQFVDTLADAREVISQAVEEIDAAEQFTDPELY